MLATLRTLFPYLLRYRWRYAGGLTALLFRGVLAAGVPLLIGRAVDQLAAGEQEAAVNSVLLALGIAACKGIAQYAMRWILITISRDIEYDLRNDISAHLVTLDRAFYERYRTGDLMARVTNDLAQVRSLLGPGLMYTAEIGVVIVTVLSIMAWTDWLLTLVIFAPMPLISLAVGHFGRRTHEQFQTVQKRFSGISVRVQEHLAGLRMLRAYNQGPAEVGRFAAANADYVEASLGLVRIWRSFYPLLELLVGLTGISLLGFGSWRVLQGAMTVGTFTMFIYFLAMLAWPMIGMGVVVNITQRGVASPGAPERAAEPQAADRRRARGAEIPRSYPGLDQVELGQRPVPQSQRVCGPRREPVGSGRHVAGTRRSGRQRQVYASQPRSQAVRPNPRRGVHRRCRYPAAAARGPAQASRVRAAGDVLVQPLDCRQHPLGATRREHGRGRGGRPAVAAGHGRGQLPGWTGYARRRARNHAFGRPEAARCAG